MRPGGKSNGESPFFEKPILSFEKPGRGNVAPIPYPDWSGERRLGERARGRLGERAGVEFVVLFWNGFWTVDVGHPQKFKTIINSASTSPTHTPPVHPQSFCQEVQAEHRGHC